MRRFLLYLITYSKKDGGGDPIPVSEYSQELGPQSNRDAIKAMLLKIREIKDVKPNLKVEAELMDKFGEFVSIYAD